MPRTKVQSEDVSTKQSANPRGLWARYPRAWAYLREGIRRYPLDQYGYAYHANRLSIILNTHVDGETVRTKVRQQRKRALREARDIADEVNGDELGEVNGDELGLEYSSGYKTLEPNVVPPSVQKVLEPIADAVRDTPSLGDSRFYPPDSSTRKDAEALARRYPNPTKLFPPASDSVYPEVAASIEEYKREAKEGFDWMQNALHPEKRPPFTSDKKKSTYNWEDRIDTLIDQQGHKQRGRTSQTHGTVTFGEDRSPVCIVTLADLHFGSEFVDYSLIKSLTKEIISLPNTYVILAGDLQNMAIRLRGVREVKGDLMDAEEQDWFFCSWLDSLNGKLLASVWDNHAVQRQEEASGQSMTAKALSDRMIYSQGYLHLDLKVGDETYKAVVSHRFRSRGRDPLIGQKSYLLNEAPEMEIAIGADTHTPAIGQYWSAGLCRTVLNTGTTDNGEYSTRNFSLRNYPIFPCFTLSCQSHTVTPYQSVASFLEARS